MMIGMIKMPQAKYAVIIVTYNREKLLRECVQHVKIQTIPAAKIIIVDNASTDGTSEYLQELTKKWKICQTITCKKNIGGAGGFAKGIACAMNYSVDCILLIDDDAILSEHYMEKLLQAREKNNKYHAFAGIVKTNHKFDVWHRRTISKIGLFFESCPQSLYSKPYFTCDIASFCGMVVDVPLIKKIGLPHAEYFIWNDDAEYSLRIHNYSRFLVVTEAILDHKTTSSSPQSWPRRYGWKDYYAIRNRILLVKEHGNKIDRFVNFADLFMRTILRNWLFGFLKIDHYNWKYEKKIVKKAIHDGKPFDNYLSRRSCQLGKQKLY